MAGSPAEPSMEELRAFAARLLRDTEQIFVEPGSLDEAIREQHDLWVMLYRADVEDGPDGPAASVV